MSTTTNPIEIMLVEDNLLELELFLDELQYTGVVNPIQHAIHGEKAMEILEARVSRGEPLPGLLLLDLHMPAMDGHETLKAIRSHDALKDLCVVLLTSSTVDEDIIKAHIEGADGYLVKPLDEDSLFALTERLEASFGWALVPSPNTGSIR